MNYNKKPAYGHGESPSCCCFHPREVVVGVCAHCLKDRLLLLLAGAGDAQQQAAAGLRRRGRSGSISLPKQVFALGSSFLQRLDSSRHHRPAADSGGGSTASGSAASLDDSFISIKFEDNGKATWDSSHNPPNGDKQQPVPVRSSSSSAVVVAAAEHAKRGGVTRWRKQVVGRLLQLARWRRSAAAGERKARTARGWIRTLTRRHRT
ncbi:unnamed protein product [Urochloa decumbens]|uniref:Uncharacterized protein n=1 Tax=Urochloa decumbens TaxID=240449 RepID=A0ABC9GR47_9POAL